MRLVSLFCLIVLVLVALLLSGDYEFVLAHHKVTRSNGGNFRYKKRATLTVVASISATDSTGSSASELPSAASSDNSNSDSTTHGIKRQLDNSSILLSSSSNLSSNSATPTNTNTSTTTTTTISPTLSTTTSTTSQTTNLTLTLTPFFSSSSNSSSSVPTSQSSDTTSTTTTTTTTAQSTTTSSSTLSSSSTLVPPLQPTPVQSAPNITPTSNLGGNSTPLPNSQYKAPQNYPADSSSKTDPQSNDQINNNNLTPNITGSGPNSSGDSGGLGSSDSSSSKDSGSSGDSGNSGDSGSSGGSGSSGESGGPGGSGGTQTAQTASPTENTDHQDFASEKSTPNKLLGPVIGGTIATLAGFGMVVLVTVRKRRKCTSLEISSGNWSDHDSLDAPIEPMTQFRPSSFLIAVRSVVNKLPLPRDSANITGESKFVERMDFDEDGQLGWSQQDDQIVVDTIDETNLIHN